MGPNDIFDDNVIGGRTRRAGLYQTWGASVTVPAGGTLIAFELVRASIDLPVGWTLMLTIDGGAAGDAFFFEVRAGLGRVSSFSAKGPLAFNTQLSFTNVPARELVVSARVDVALIAGATLSAQACPTAWPSSYYFGNVPT